MYYNSNSVHDFVYTIYPNGDLIVYPIREKTGHEITEIDRKKDRFYQLSYQKYRIISSAAITLLKTAKNKPIFLTLTFNEKLKIDEKTANVIWCRFIKNFKKTYDCKNYVGVLEYTKKYCPHYHFIADYPFKSIVNINNAWLSAIHSTFTNDNYPFILGSVRLPKKNKSVVDVADNVVYYLCKYFSKGIGQRYRTKCYFISRELRQLSRSRQLTANQFVYLSDNLEPKKHYNFEHCHVYCYDADKMGILAQDLKDIYL
jgi:hypothetical protein